MENIHNQISSAGKLGFYGNLLSLDNEYIISQKIFLSILFCKNILFFSLLFAFAFYSAFSSDVSSRCSDASSAISAVSFFDASLSSSMTGALRCSVISVINLTAAYIRTVMKKRSPSREKYRPREPER